MNNEYRIFNATPIQKRIEELQKYVGSRRPSADEYAKMHIYREILSQSTPLIPEIEKAYFEGECYGIGTDACTTKQEYISNLKLDI